MNYLLIPRTDTKQKCDSWEESRLLSSTTKIALGAPSSLGHALQHGSKTIITKIMVVAKHLVRQWIQYRPDSRVKHPTIRRVWEQAALDNADAHQDIASLLACDD